MNAKEYGKRAYSICGELFPICRSITGDGVRETHDIIRKYIPELKTFEIPSGTQVFDWVVPDEWNIKDAYVADEDGSRLIDFQRNNLHVVGYSEPIDAYMTWKELEPHIYTQSGQPDVIPYVTSYYGRRWGFCVSENEKLRLEAELGNRSLHVVIDSTLKPGSLTYSECILPGESKKEILITTYTCHPSMANNECSGPALSTVLVEWLKQRKNRYTYRFIFIPEHIGAVAYICQHMNELKKNTVAGFCLSCVGDDNNYSYIETRYGDSVTDRVVDNIFQYSDWKYDKYSYLKRGSDEDRFNAPGVDIPMVGICRSKYGCFSEYHTSADNMSYVSPEGFAGAFEVMRRSIELFERNYIYRMTCYCDPQLGKRGLYPTISQKDSYGKLAAMMNFIAYADGTNDLLDVSEKIQVSALELADIADKLESFNLVEKLSKRTERVINDIYAE